MEDAKLEAYYNKIKDAAPKGRTGGLGSLKGPGNKAKGSWATREDAKATPAGSSPLYRMFVKAGESGYFAYDDDGNVVNEETTEPEDTRVGLIPCMATLRKNGEAPAGSQKRKRESEPEQPTKKKKKKGKKEKKEKKQKEEEARAVPVVAEKKRSKKEKKQKKQQKQEAAAPAPAPAPKAAAGSAAAEAAGGDVRVLRTKAEFDHCLKASKKTGQAVLVDFSATWCGPCQSIAPVFALLAAKSAAKAEAKGEAGPIFAKVDADENSEACDAAGVGSFPMFHLYSLGIKVEELDGADKKALKQMVKKWSTPVAVAAKVKKEKKEKKAGGGFSAAFWDAKPKEGEAKGGAGKKSKEKKKRKKAEPEIAQPPPPPLHDTKKKKKDKKKKKKKEK